MSMKVTHMKIYNEQTRTWTHLRHQVHDILRQQTWAAGSLHGTIVSAIVWCTLEELSSIVVVPSIKKNFVDVQGIMIA